LYHLVLLPYEYISNMEQLNNIQLRDHGKVILMVTEVSSHLLALEILWVPPLNLEQSRILE